MKTSETGWVRGAVVIGIAGIMMAVALFSPALAVKLATTGYVKQKVKQVNGVALTALRNPSYLQSPPQSIAAGFLGTIEGSCQGRTVVSGGASSGGSAAGTVDLLESYPSDGNIGTLNVSGRNGWSVTVANSGTTAVNVYEYLVCADTTAAGGISGGPARSSAGSAKWSFTSEPMG